MDSVGEYDSGLIQLRLTEILIFYPKVGVKTFSDIVSS